jgi:hypothetical protein
MGSETNTFCGNCGILNTLYWDPMNPTSTYLQIPRVIPDCLNCGKSLAGSQIVEEVRA